MNDLHVYDTTLRDGAQQEGLNLSVADKLAIAAPPRRPRGGLHRGRVARRQPQGHRVLRPGTARAVAAPRHAGRVRRHAARRHGGGAGPTGAGAARLGAPVVTLVAKSHLRHVETALRTTAQENLAMVRDTVGFLRGEGRRVFLDAEHFFDGYLADRGLRPGGAADRGRGGRRGGRPVRHQRRACCRRRSVTSWRTSSTRPGCAWASTATTTPAAPWPTRWRRWPRAPATCRAPSTATASAPATPTC